MVVASVDYGTISSHTGTLAEVMGAINGKSTTAIIAIFYNGTNITAVVRTKG